jgi:hypothetical protein
VTLTLVGELDLATTPRLEKYLTTIAATQQELIVIDLRQLTFLTAGGRRRRSVRLRHTRRTTAKREYCR